MPDTIIAPETSAFPRNRSPEIDKLAAALAKAQGGMENAKRDAENPGFKRDGKIAKYADLASVWEAIREPLGTNGLSVVQLPATLESAVEIETILLHESGQFIRNVLWMPCQQMTAHTIGSAITYGRRYALMSVVGIAPEDDDGNAASGVGDGHKPGPAGSERAGGDFRPAGPRRGNASSWGAGGKQGAVDEAQRDGLIDDGRPKGTLPSKANANGPETQNAIKRVEWVKKAIEGFASAQTKDELTEWWKSERERLDVIETKMPAEYERLLMAFDAAIERTAQKVA